MKKVILSLVAIVALFSCLEANAFTLVGEMRAPDAYILPNKAARIQVTGYMRKEQSNADADFEFVPSGMLQVGVLNRLELGFMGGDDVVLGHLKIKVIEETTGIPQVAVGIDNVFSKVEDDAIANPPSGSLGSNPDRVFYERNSIYVAFSKQTVLRGLFGIPELSAMISGGFGRNRFVGQAEIAEKLQGLFLSAEFSPYPALVFIGEMDGHNLNLGAKYSVDKFQVRLGYLGFEESLKGDSANHRVALGVSYLFDMFGDARKRPVMPDSPVYSAPGTPTQQQVIQQQGGTAPSSSTNDLFEELKRLRESREQAQKVLEELRQQLKDLEQEASKK